ncbi:MAG: vitamin B12 dependent-methionine synthase activation domain-containing protein [Bacillota bacterium]|nr:vitamin B12 dependent-methionine synthase activation domain-containing protein [Bacillota bacterium]
MMNLQITRSIDRKAWLTALHAKGAADSRLSDQMDEAERLLKEAARPKAVYRLVGIDAILNKSKSIAKHLEGCDKAALMAVTLGAGVDQLLRKTQVTDMAMAVIVDSGASILIEQLAEDFEEVIEAGPFTTPRFSPGYGDWPITEQTRIVRMLDAQRQIGLNVTKDSLLIPRKSITAVIGISDHPVKGSLATCEQCILKDKCELRKEGKYCGDKL